MPGLNTSLPVAMHPLNAVKKPIKRNSEMATLISDIQTVHRKDLESG